MTSEAVERRSQRPGRRPRDFHSTDLVDLLDAGFTETPRQRQVLDAVVQGLENKEIARDLGISEQRAKELVSTLLKKFEVGSRAALARVAINMRILGLDTRASVPYSYFFDESPVLIALTEGPQHRYSLVNSAFVQTFGDRHYIGRTVRECFPDMPKQAMSARDNTYVHGRRYAGSEVARAFAMPSGGQREFTVSFVTEPIRSASNEITGVVFYGLDMTDFVATRRALEQPSAAALLG